MSRIGPTLWLLIAASFPAVTGAQWQLLPDAEPQTVFAGNHRVVKLVWLNAGDQAARVEIHTRLWQASSSSAIRLGDAPWKTLLAQSQQTVLDLAALDFPPVKTPTPFIIQWLAGSHQLLGATRVLVYPTNLLDELKRLLPRSGETLGVLDPHQLLIPTLQSAAIPFINLAEGALTNFSGQLLLAGPCHPSDPEWEGLASRILLVARNGTPVVWIQPPSTPANQPCPSFYLVAKNRTVVVVVKPELVDDLPARPQSQLNLIYCCKLALHPEPFDLPGSNPNPQL